MSGPVVAENSPSIEKEEATELILKTIRLGLKGAEGVLNLSPIPGLDKVAASLVVLIEMVEQTRENDQSRRSLAGKIRRISDIIIFSAHSISSGGPGPLPISDPNVADLLARINGLQKSLSDAAQYATKLGARRFLFRCLSAHRDSKILKQLNVMIEEDVSAFELRNGIKVEALVSEVSGILKQLQSAVNTIENRQANADRREILKNLGPADASHESLHTQHIERALEGTRQSLFDELVGWATPAEPSEPSVFVLMGEAGMGKSTIAMEMAHRLKEKKILGCSFFFGSGSTSLQASDLFKTIAHDLAHAHEEMSDHVITGAQCHYRLRRGHSAQMQYQVEDLLKIPLGNVRADHGPVVILVDAVDECAGDHNTIRKMLELLINLPEAAKFPLRIFLTTRPEKHIHDFFTSSAAKHHVRIMRLSSVDKAVVSDDIKNYLDNRRQDPVLPADFLCLHPDATQQLTEMADGLFIYAKVAMDFLCNSPHRADEYLDLLLSQDNMAEDGGEGGETESTGTSAYSKLDALYGSVLDKAFGETVLTKEDRQVLRAVAMIRDSLSIDTMAELLNVETKHILNVVDRLQSVIIRIPDHTTHGKIRPIHATFPQYLTDKRRCADKFYVDPLKANHHLAGNCLKVLNSGNNLRRRPMADKSLCPFTYHRILDSAADCTVAAHVRYACTHWAVYVCGSASPDASSLIEPVNHFCSRKLLLWLETMSYLNHLDVAVHMLQAVLIWYKTQSAVPKWESRICDLLHDSLRLSIQFYGTINHCPEQIYASALPQAPSCAFHDYPDHSQKHAIRLMSPRSTHWSPHLRTVTTGRGSVVGLKFHPEGLHFASCSDDGTVDVWDALSGEHLFGLPLHHEVEAFDMYWHHHEGRIILSPKGEGDAIYVDTKHGQHRQSLKSEGLSPFSSVFGPSSSATSVHRPIYSAVRNQALVLRWDSHMDDPSHFECDTIISTPISFALDGSLAAAGSKQDVCVWSIEDRRSLRMFHGHGGEIVSTAFFPPSYNLLASTSKDNRIIIWDIKNATKLKELVRPSTSPISQVAVSADGHILAVASDAVYLWETQTWTPLPTLSSSHSSAITSIAFSPNNDFLISASNDGLIQVWDVIGISSVFLDAFGHRSSVTALAFSPEGHRLVSADQDGQILEWKVSHTDHSQSEPPRKVQKCTSSVTFLAMSHSGKRLVSITSADGILLMNLETEESTKLSHTGAAFAALSSDDQWLVTSKATLSNRRDDHSLRIWKVSKEGSKIQQKFDITLSEAKDALTIREINISSDNKYLHVDCELGKTLVFKLEDGQVIPDSGHHRQLHNKCQVIDGAITVAGSDSDRIPVYYLEPSRWTNGGPGAGRKDIYAETLVHSHPLYSNKHLIAIGTQSGRVIVVDISGILLALGEHFM